MGTLPHSGNAFALWIESKGGRVERKGLVSPRVRLAYSHQCPSCGGDIPIGGKGCVHCGRAARQTTIEAPENPA